MKLSVPSISALLCTVALVGGCLAEPTPEDLLDEEQALLDDEETLDEDLALGHTNGALLDGSPVVQRDPYARVFWPCRRGYVRNRFGQCVDINECAAGTDLCSANAVCTNTPGAYSCTCSAGYAGDGESCVDINECVTGTHNCGPLALCTNTVGSFYCL